MHLSRHWKKQGRHEAADLHYPTLGDTIRKTTHGGGADAYGIRNSVRTLHTAACGPQSHGCVREVCQLGGVAGHQRQTMGGTGSHKLGGGQVRHERQIETIANRNHAQEVGGRRATKKTSKQWRRHSLQSRSQPGSK